MLLFVFTKNKKKIIRNFKNFNTGYLKQIIFMWHKVILFEQGDINHTTNQLFNLPDLIYQWKIIFKIFDILKSDLRDFLQSITGKEGLVSCYQYIIK